MRVGVIARETADEAWSVALERFPEDRRGQITHRVAMSISDSHWHKQLSDREHAGGPDAGADGEPEPYWLGPFQNYNTFCPYLVGSHARVAREIAQYVGLGCSTFILDIPPSEEELEHTGVVFREALADRLLASRVAAGLRGPVGRAAARRPRGGPGRRAAHLRGPRAALEPARARCSWSRAAALATGWRC